MNTPHRIVLISLLGLTPVMAETKKEQPPLEAPTGSLEVNKTWVPAGSRPSLKWNIVYPPLIELTPQGRLVVKTQAIVEIRVVGAAFQSSGVHTPVTVHTRVGEAQWEALFSGPDHTVKPARVLKTQFVEAGTGIDFAARAQSASGRWYTSRNTLTKNPTVAALFNGSKVPHFTPVAQQGTISSFLSQDISPNNRVTIGPYDVIYLFECFAEEPDSGGYDLQDVVVLVTVKNPPQE